ncbi:MAG: hypothetical protein KatS3mg111_1378 [Pirellulaceae bacterium]|nr:MAG: hypothetical protein KatS3mg111_1378 [Pirellulaceae bacterium]
MHSHQPRLIAPNRQLAMVPAYLCAGLAAWLLFSAAHGQDNSAIPGPTEIRLWPSEAPFARGGSPHDVPSAYWYPATSAGADEDSRSILIVLPGGGYGTLAIDHEGHDIARWANSLGMSALVVQYRHGGRGYRHPVPMLDAQRAVRLVRHRASQWHVDPQRVGVIGFSAGGHLASTLLTHFDNGNVDAEDAIDRLSCRPDFGILCYPVIALGEEFTHAGSQRNLLGEQPDASLVASLSNDKQVQQDTPPCFVWHTADDRVVAVENSLRFAAALIRKGVPCELHVFPHGRHGLGLARGHVGPDQWPELCSTWMKTIGVLRDGEPAR